MKMKLIALISASVLAIVSFAGCTNQSAKPTNSEKSVLNTIRNTTSEDQLNFLLYLHPRLGGCYKSGNSMPRDLENFLNTFDLIELESEPRVFNADSSDEYREKYYVLRSNNEKIGDYYVYVFFRNNEQTEEKWWRNGRAVRVSRRLLAKDFENITVGSTLDDVITVDPVTTTMVPQDFTHSDGTPISYLDFETMHYTVDGLYYIKFERESAEDEYLITQIEFDPSYEIPIRDMGRFSDNEYANGLDLDNPEPPVYQKIELKHLPE